jgi:selenocysteine lyase/cysteine desulfurase
VGRPLKTSENDFSERFYEPWKKSNDEPWEKWLETINDFTFSLAKVFNAKQSEFCPQVNLSSGLTKILMSLKQVQKKKSVVLVCEIDFPGMGFALKKSLPEDCEIRFIPVNEDITNSSIWDAYMTEDIDLVFVSHAYSNTGQLSPISDVISMARSRDIISILDIAQSAGIVPIDLTALKPDFMLGSSVKWLCGGPGAAYLWVNTERLSSCEPKDVGWFSHENPFEFDIHNFRYHDSALKFWGGTPVVAPFVIATNSINYFTKIGIKNIRKHNQALIAKTANEIDLEFVSPRDEAIRGGTMILDFGSNQQKVLNHLQDNNISVDLRSHGIRISPHIYNDEQDIDQLISVIKSTKF